uniref:RNA helicase n=1 Tax=Calcidiscus leptoporus TaxID=127549 RepID=A0A7S0P1T0_9EUKA|mmetsp:Transcript_51943/g.119487  ORF Transcript_51943/g.119487 Transcript_51943/m.119487 type:complete len:714 (+) Transcript_51943:70-2211(+)
MDSTRAELSSALANGDVVIVQGDTGCGKTTQLPQLLLSAGYSRVCITQPRRVAAIAAARRVASERSGCVGGEVGYAVRFEQKCSSSTRIKYVTDGVLLREAIADPCLCAYDALVLDEAHERSLNTDVLFALVKRLLSHRREKLLIEGEAPAGPQRLIIASATMDADHFSQYFWGARILRVHSQMHEVNFFHVAKALPSDAARVEAALDVAMRLHCEWPATPSHDILLFLTGQEEISTAAHAARLLSAQVRAERPHLPELLVLPLHASLPSAEQARVFASPPLETRKLVLATNIAETSLTIVGVRAVIDPGVVKEKHFDRERGMELLSVVPISQSAARQRAGRAGRTASGEVWRLYSEEQLAAMPAAQLPEIHRTNLANAVLSLKLMGVTHTLQLDWLDAPEPKALVHATKQLYVLGALTAEGELTSLGAAMARLPLEPTLSRTLLRAVELRCADSAASICALACSEDVFCRAGPPELLLAADAARARLESSDGEQMTLFNVFEEWRQVAEARRDTWCAENGLQARALRMAEDVRLQLLGMLPKGVTAAERRARRDEGESADAAIRSRCRQAVCAGLFMQSARRVRGLSSSYLTLCEPQQTVRVKGGVKAERLTAEHVVFRELVFAGRLVMHHTCAVEAVWLEPLLPRLAGIDIARLLGSASCKPADPSCMSAAPSATDATLANARVEAFSGRRNDDQSVEAARQRFKQRKFNP